MKIRGLVHFRIYILMMALLLTACDDQDYPETSTPSGITRPPQSDLDQGQQIARAAGIGAIVPRTDGITPSPATAISGYWAAALIKTKRLFGNDSVWRTRLGINLHNGKNTMPGLPPIRTRMPIGPIQPLLHRIGWAPLGPTAIPWLLKELLWPLTSRGSLPVP